MKTARTIRRVGWRLIVCLALLVWIFHAIFMSEARLGWSGATAWEQLNRGDQWRFAWQWGPSRLWASLASIHLGALLASFVIMGVTIFIGVFRWMVALRVQGLPLPWHRALEISLVAHFFNSFLLGSTGGDLMKAYYAARETAHRKAEAVVTVFVDRVIGLWSMLFFALLMTLLNRQVLATHQRLGWLMLVILGMLVLGTAFVIPAFWGGLSNHVAGARDWLRRLPKGEWLLRSLDSCRKFGRSRGFFLRMVGISMVLNLVCVLQYVVLAGGLGIGVSGSVWLLVVPAIICISALPVTPSGLGVRENLYVAVLAGAPFLIPETSALALSLLAYAGSLFWSLIGGITYLLLRDRQQLGEVTGATDAEG